MKKFLLLIFPVLLLSFAACASGEDQKNFTALHEAYSARGEGVEGYEVTEIETYDGFDFFCVRVCLNTDDAVTVDDYMWYEANVMLFSSREEADAAYEQNQQTGLGGTCLQQGKILIYWMEKDPFTDLYEEVFYSVFG
ncbi:MAG: hypothetical protein J6B86_06825 [Clostridia bacterium]|nr:hypothetical protein [Clostridia bacterium]